jgi:photosystem II stability/assembly factor-like uncharacterized protein
MTAGVALLVAALGVLPTVAPTTATAAPVAASWTRAAVPAGLRGAALHGLSCSRARCLAIGEICRAASCPGLAPQVVLESRDLGATWSKASVPTHFVFAFEGVACPSPAFCAVGGTRNAFTPSPTAGLEVTTDLGRHWVSHAVSGLGHLLTATCPSTRVCFAVGFSSPPVSQVEFGQIARSLDGGATWATTLFPQTGDVDGISCVTPSVCTAFAASADGGHSVLLHTTNAGVTWSQRPVPMHVGKLRWLTCRTASSCVGYSLRPFGRPGSVDTTHDLGATWTTRSTGVVNVLYFAACPRVTTCAFVGQSSNAPLLDVTTDGGTSWAYQSVAGVRAGRLWSIACLDSWPRRCVAVGQWWTHAPRDGGPLLLWR